MNEFTEHLAELFETFGPVSIRAMFGGHGIYRDGLMFGLVAGDALYLKADDRNRGMFESCGLPRFEYAKQGKTITVSYYLAPGEALEDPRTLAEWSRSAFEAALRGRRTSRKGR